MPQFDDVWNAKYFASDEERYAARNASRSLSSFGPQMPRTAWRKETSKSANAALKPFVTRTCGALKISVTLFDLARTGCSMVSNCTQSRRSRKSSRRGDLAFTKRRDGK